MASTSAPAGDLAANLKAYLMQCDANGRSVHDHLEEIMLDLMENDTLDFSANPERLAEVSELLKSGAFGHGGVSRAAESAPAPDAERHARATAQRALFVDPVPKTETKIDKPTPYTTVTTTTVKPLTAPGFTSVVAEAHFWRYAGLGLPEAECLLLDRSITQLSRDKGLEEVRFVGKIFGTKADYLVVSSRRYVAEGEEVLEEINTMPKPARKKVEVDVQPEPGYKGLNRLSFWVAPHAAAEWVLLPDVTPQQIGAARKAKKLFSGDLDAPVNSFPAFEWPERILLRAQLARLLAATYVAPSSAVEQFVPEDEEEDDDEEEGRPRVKPAKYHPLMTVNKEYAPDEEAGVAALNDLEQWQHAEAFIYQTGRATKVPPKPEVEGEEEEEPEEPEEEDEEAPAEEEERELLLPLKKDTLQAVIDVPREPNPEDEEEEEPEEPEEPEDEEGDAAAKEDNDPEKPIEEEDVPDDDPLKKKIYAWTTRVANGLTKKHAVCVVQSLRWPGAVAYAAQQGKRWGCVYMGNGMKASEGTAFTPAPAPPIVKEAADMLEVADPTAANEKLVLRGEEPKERDSEDEKEEEEEEDDEEA